MNQSKTIETEVKNLYKTLSKQEKKLGSGALYCQILLLRIIENNKRLTLPRRVKKGIRIGHSRIRAFPQGLIVG